VESLTARELAEGVNACGDNGLMGRGGTNARGAGVCAIKPVDGMAQQ
jgi:hypothetical protein